MCPRVVLVILECSEFRTVFTIMGKRSIPSYGRGYMHPKEVPSRLETLWLSKVGL